MNPNNPNPITNAVPKDIQVEISDIKAEKLKYNNKIEQIEKGEGLYSKLTTEKKLEEIDKIRNQIRDCDINLGKFTDKIPTPEPLRSKNYIFYFIFILYLIII